MGSLVMMKREGGDLTSQIDIDGLRNVMHICRLRDLNFEGYSFTWTNNREDEGNY